MRHALSNNYSSVDDQTADVVSWLSNDPAHADMMEHQFLSDFPEYNDLIWRGAWVDTDESFVDPEYMEWVRNWIETNTLVYWEEGEPWIGECSHSWVAGMMHVHSEDLEYLAANGTEIECQYCEEIYEPLS